VVIVNRTLARLSWPDASAIGRRFRTTDDGGSSWLTVVGVVGDVRQMGLDLPPRPEMYVPYRQFDSQPWFAPRDLVVRASGDPTPLTAAVVAQVHAVDPALPVTKIRLLDDLLDEWCSSHSPPSPCCLR
jgi:putative ABC transport system permease protein